MSTETANTRSRLPIILAGLALCIQGSHVIAQIPQASITSDTSGLQSEVRVVAGESRSAAWNARGAPIVSIVSTRTTPALDFPIRVGVDSAQGATVLRVMAPPATPPGQYTVDVTGHDSDGQALSATLRVVVDAVTISPAASSARVPVILLNGFQLFCRDTTSTLTASTDTFGQLAYLLEGDGVPVLFFNNCMYPDLSIEQLAAQLRIYVAGLHYTDGAPVTQVDLVAHSMGGLIVRSYLAGKQATSGGFDPPVDTKVRKAVFIATPHFGSFLAPNLGVQLSEMDPGSAFLWNLARWNQGGDDLRGVDALAVIGSGGYAPLFGFPPVKGSDGVVTLTSASLDFTRDPSRTRILPYCHADSSLIDIIPFSMDCNGFGIANVDHAPKTGEIVRSFLADTTAWLSFGMTASQDPYLSQYGGIYFALENAGGTQYVSDLTQVSWGNETLQNGAATHVIYYSEFVKGTATFQGTSTSLGPVSCGPLTEPAGYYTAFRCKYAPVISRVSPLLSNVPKIVGSGTTITISGVGFGQQRCSNCQVFAYPGGSALQVSSWSDQAIAANLPATYNGFVTLVVQTAGGQDEIGIMTAASNPPVISLSTKQLQFAYTLGSSSPASQPVGVTNAGSGTLNWTATANVPWLVVSPSSGTAPFGFSVSVNTAGLSVGTSSGAVTVSSAGAASQTVSVTLVVTAQLTASPQSLAFAYQLGGTVPPTQTIRMTSSTTALVFTATAAGVSWLSLSPVSGITPGSINVTVNPVGLGPGSYAATVSVSATGAVSPATVQVTLTISQASLAVPHITSGGVVGAGLSTPRVKALSPNAIASVFGDSFAPVGTQRVVGSADLVNGRLPTVVNGVCVYVNSTPAPIFFLGSTQINFQVPQIATGTAGVQVAISCGTPNEIRSSSESITGSATTSEFFYFKQSSDGKNPIAAVNALNGNYIGPVGLIPGVNFVPASPGDILTLFFTGGGATSPMFAPGELPGSAGNVTGTVGISMGGVSLSSSDILYAGVAPGFAGLYQLNARVPAGAQQGTQPVILTIGSSTSPVGYLLIGPGQ